MLRKAPLALLFVGAACTKSDQPPPRVDTARPDSTPAAAPATAQKPDPSRWVVTPRGYGPVLAGMALDSLSATLGEPLRAQYATGSNCAYVRPSALPKDVLVMVERDTVVRIDVRGTSARTVDSAGVGDTEASVLKHYEGRVHVTPHKYTAAGHYLTVSAPPDSQHLIVFETDGRTVVTYRAGRRPAVELVEGCS